MQKTVPLHNISFIINLREVEIMFIFPSHWEKSTSFDSLSRKSQVIERAPSLDRVGNRENSLRED